MVLVIFSKVIWATGRKDLTLNTPSIPPQYHVNSNETNTTGDLKIVE
jgi:hypothetical protein